MYYSASAGIIIAIFIIMLVIKTLLKTIIDAFDKGYKNDQDAKK